MRIIILALLFFTGFTSISLKTIAQEDTTAKDDNYVLWKYMYELNRAIVIKNIAAADTLNVEKINEAVRMSKASYQSGSICYSPDKSFEIVSAEGADYSNSGSNCLNRSRIYLKNSDATIDMAAGILNVDTIFKLTGNKYLAIQSSTGCSEAQSVSHKRATLFSIVDNQVKYFSIKNIKDTTATGDRGLDLFQYDIAGLEKYPLVLNFDARNKRLTYSYILDADTSLNTDTENYITGYYEYRGGAFYAGKLITKRQIKR